MKPAEITLLRLASQQLAGPNFSNVADLVGWMGAIQAQDYPMSRWAVGVRLPGCTDADVISAIDRGEIIRTHLLRPTWHFAAAEDVSWLIDLSAAHIKASQRHRDRELGLSGEVYARSNATIEMALSGGEHLTRTELVEALQKAGIATDQNRASHLFMRAEVEKIICSGENHNGKPTYALFAQRVRTTKSYSREEAVVELASRYFISRGHATLKDFTWWSGLTAGEARHALELIGDELRTDEYARQAYWMPGVARVVKTKKTATHLLPGYDELMISYADRSAFTSRIDVSMLKKISANGMFANIVLVEGQVAGTWKRKVKKDALEIEIHAARNFNPEEMAMVSEAANRYGGFMRKVIEPLRWGEIEG